MVALTNTMVGGRLPPLTSEHISCETWKLHKEAHLRFHTRNIKKLGVR